MSNVEKVIPLLEKEYARVFPQCKEKGDIITIGVEPKKFQEKEKWSCSGWHFVNALNGITINNNEVVLVAGYTIDELQEIWEKHNENFNRIDN